MLADAKRRIPLPKNCQLLIILLLSNIKLEYLLPTFM